MYLIDGHNLLYAAKSFDEQFLSFNEDDLCKVLDEFFNRINSTALLVFDGTGPRDKRPYARFSRMDVEFSGLDYEADDILIREIEEDSAPKRLTVVTADRKIRKVAQRRKSISLPSFDFWYMVLEQLEKPAKRRAEPKEKIQGLTDSETDSWMKMFGFDSPGDNKKK